MILTNLKDINLINPLVSFIEKNAKWEDINVLESKNNGNDIFGYVWPISDAVILPLDEIFNDLQFTRELINSWVHCYKPEQAIDWHIHRGVENIGLLFLKNFNSGGAIEFENGTSHLPKQGDFIQFPANLKHRSLPGDSGERLVFGFHYK